MFDHIYYSMLTGSVGSPGIKRVQSESVRGQYGAAVLPACSSLRGEDDGDSLMNMEGSVLERVVHCNARLARTVFQEAKQHINF